jgi:hypothetical protein
MSPRFSNGLRTCLALLGVSSVLAPCLLLACGSHVTPSFAPSDDASTIVTVVTYGGGAPQSSSSGAAVAPVNPFSRESVSDGGSSSGVGASSGGRVSGSGSSSGGAASSGAGASSGGPASSGSSSSSGGGASSGSTTDDGGGSSSGGFIYIGGAADASPDSPASCDPYNVPMCGTTPCDLRSNTCCVDLNANARCIPGANAMCNTNEATGHCLYECECPTGQVCCGVENSLVGVVQTSCQTVPDGGHCSPYPQTSIQASAQLCHFNSECTQDQCITQTCIYNIVVQVCGLQSQYPFNCH